MKQPLIVAFYICLLITTALRVVEFAFCIAKPSSIPEAKVTAVFYAMSLALYCAVCVELILVLTIHRLYLAIKLILGETTPIQMKREERIGLGLASIFGVCYFILDLTSVRCKYAFYLEIDKIT